MIAVLPTVRLVLCLALPAVVFTHSIAPPIAASAPNGSLDAPLRGGDAVVVVPFAADRVLLDGNGSTEFALRLPPDAACPGDTANDDWRVQSFIVPVADDPAQLEYDSLAPKGDGRYALYGTDTNAYMQQFTLPNSAPGEPGRVPAVAPLSFEVFPPGTLPDGRYRIGIACTYFRDSAVYWDTQIDIAADTQDQPGQLAWSVVDRNVTVPDGQTGRNSAALVLIVVLVVSLGVLLLMRRQLPSRRPNAPPRSNRELDHRFDPK